MPIKIKLFNRQLEIIKSAHAKKRIKCYYLTLKKQYYNQVDRGVDFVGYVIMPHYIAPRRAILHKAKSAIHKAGSKEKKGANCKQLSWDASAFKIARTKTFYL